MEAATKQKPKAARLEPGDEVHVVYWSPFALPGDEKAGTWEVMSGRLFVAGSQLVCFETPNPGLPHGGSENPLSLPSPFRWTTHDRVFRTNADAEASARSLPRPT